MLKKSQIQTLIFCNNRDFKQRATMFLNNIGIHTEKHSVQSIEEAKEILSGMNSNPALRNLIIQGDSYPDLFKPNSEDLKAILQPDMMFALAYFSEETFADFNKDYGFKNLMIEQTPFVQNHFNQAFHNRGAGGPVKNAAPSGLSALGISAPIKSASKPAKPAPKKNISAFEASAHVKETIDHLNNIAKDRSDLAGVLSIGQTFNGFIGAFAYFGEKKGYLQLRQLAKIIDITSRDYTEDSQKTEITPEHSKLMLESARTSFRILQLLRDNKEIPDELVTESDTRWKEFESLGGKDSETLDQSSIDSLLDS